MRYVPAAGFQVQVVERFVEVKWYGRRREDLMSIAQPPRKKDEHEEKQILSEMRKGEVKVER